LSVSLVEKSEFNTVDRDEQNHHDHSINDAKYSALAFGRGWGCFEKGILTSDIEHQCIRCIGGIVQNDRHPNRSA
jgi:hypothetical protein